MKKIWIAIILLFVLFAGSFWYVNFLKKSVDFMITNINDAYNFIDTDYEKAEKSLDKVSAELDKSTMIFCAFIDQKLISDVEDELLIARELYLQERKNELRLSLIRLKEKIDCLKDTEEFNFKKILYKRTWVYGNI